MFSGEECQRTGTEYRPPKGRRKVTENQDLRKGVNSVEDGGVKKDDGEVSDADSLSDLYPGEKFIIDCLDVFVLCIVLAEY